MCSLCGVLGGNEHWADAVPRDGVYTRSTDAITRRRERAHRVRIANRILAQWRLSLSDWQSTAYLLSTPTGRTEIVEDFGQLWPVAERLLGSPIDPLSLDLIGRFEAGRA